MKYLMRISPLGIPILVAITILMSCAAMDRITQPTAKSTSSTGPTIDEAQKEKYDGPKARIAVTKFLDKSAKGKATGQIGDGMADMLAHALLKTNRFIVLERQSLPDVLQEQDLGASGRVSPETAARIGQIEGADLLVLGAITEFEPGSAGAEGKGSRRQRNLLDLLEDILGSIKTSHVALIVRVVDTKTARIVASEQVEGKATDISGMINLGGGDLTGVFSAFSKTPMEKAIRVAIEEAVKKIVDKTPPDYYRYSQEPPPPPPPPKPPEPKPRTTQVTEPYANLREKPQGKIIGKVNKGTSLLILEEIEKWLRVRLEDGTEAWIWKLSTSEAPKTSPAPFSAPTLPKARTPSAM
jgi:curli biogenesis system outer membrane secretion channel CsgG